MASRQMEKRYSEKQSNFAKKLKKKGRKATISKTTAESIGLEKAELSNPVDVWILPMTSAVDFKDDVRMEDKLYFVTGMHPIEGKDILTDGDDENTVYRVLEIRYGQTVLYYKVQCRA